MIVYFPTTKKFEIKNLEIKKKSNDLKTCVFSSNVYNNLYSALEFKARTLITKYYFGCEKSKIYASNLLSNVSSNDKS